MTTSTCEFERVALENPDPHAQAYHNERFMLTERGYNVQFSHFYQQRLKAFKPNLIQQAESLWSNFQDPQSSEKSRFYDNVLDVKGGQLCYVVGTVYAKLSGKPSIIDDVKKDLWVVDQPPVDSYFEGEPEYSIEDESGRLKIIGECLKSSRLVTGAVVALLGRESETGDFEVDELMLPGLSEQIQMVPQAEPRYMAFVSGLNITGDSKGASDVFLLNEYFLGGITIDSLSPRNIIKLVVAGNVYAPLSSQEESTSSSDPTDLINKFLGELCLSLPVDILPGTNDPTTRGLPQQPLHHSLFPAAINYSSLALVPNPYDSQFGDLRVMGTSGQPITDLVKCGPKEATNLDWLETTLQLGHYVPNSPDTLCCYPYEDKDPFLMTGCPHIYFAGNQPKFSTSLINGPKNQKVRLITIPSFSETQQIVLVETSTLDVSVITLA